MTICSLSEFISSPGCRSAVTDSISTCHKLPGCLSPHIHHCRYEAWNESGRQGRAWQRRLLLTELLSAPVCPVFIVFWDNNVWNEKQVLLTAVKKSAGNVFPLCVGLADTREVYCSTHSVVDLWTMFVRQCYLYICSPEGQFHVYSLLY